jgi:hypothetical protein
MSHVFGVGAFSSSASDVPLEEPRQSCKIRREVLASIAESFEDRRDCGVRVSQTTFAELELQCTR